MSEETAIYSKTEKGKDLELIMLEMEKMEAIPLNKRLRRKQQLDKLTLMSMDFIGKWGIHPVDLMRTCGFVAPK
jgi:hypothetical protein